MPASHRSCIREAGVMAAFEHCFRKEGDFSVLFLNAIALFELPGYDTEFAEELLRNMKEHEADIQADVVKFAPAWPWENIHYLDRAILLTSLAELLYMKDTPAKIVINEYVEIAKQYGGEGTRKFINGVLGTAYAAAAKQNPAA